MIYLIGGTARVGKSTLASLILERNRISNISTDVLRNLLDFSPTKVGINDLREDQKTEAFFPYFLQFLKIIQNKYTDYVVEGNLFTPEQAAFIQDKIQIKCCFLGTSNITLDDLKKIDINLDWVSKLEPEKQEKLPEYFIKKSKITSEEAAKYNFPYFDIYPNRQEALKSAYEVLLN